MTEKYRVIFQIEQAQPDLLRKLKNRIKSLKEVLPAVQVELIFHGNAVTSLKGTDLNEIDADVVACETALKGNGVILDDTSPVKVVPSALAHMIKRQHEGWAYIKLT